MFAACCCGCRYLIFDGDVDAVWVENMNSVMDDNKLLTLPNGERIRLQQHCKLVFEVFDLQVGVLCFIGLNLTHMIV